MADLRLRIRFAEDTTDAEADELTRDLVAVVERLPIDRVEPETAPEAPAGARSADPTTVAGAVVLAGLAVRTVLPHVVTLAQEWLRTRAQRSLTVEADGVSLTLQGDHSPREVKEFIDLLEAARSGGEDGTAGEVER
ncbi:hypothetical protein ACFPZ0_01250 [Streptomonospora nanhaiensis]|uniref:hypothetical protein n=1 Tax=Streptomonospora nanhaiensis TaxID=1323731 RepID=UPI001C99F234|nr:hypothetical protein [Streptomonospora nanhaiensis]MBX9387557.1 hypothetical protein [Streptomonospora nanhaiensis]